MIFVLFLMFFILNHKNWIFFPPADPNFPFNLSIQQREFHEVSDIKHFS